jgi:hypothetical protein
LSLLVANEGFTVISYEPESSGFPLMSKFRETLLSVWLGTSGTVIWVSEKYGVFSTASQPASYVFAVNVVEHIEEWPRLVSEIFENETDDVVTRFVFPNYLYPYEPHFNMPTLFRKNITARFMKSRITKSHLAEPQQFWDELSWPTGSQMKRVCGDFGLLSNFNSESFQSYLVRLRQDEQFRKRKGTFMLLSMYLALPVLVGIGKLLPPQFLPIIDVRISRSVS